MQTTKLPGGQEDFIRVPPHIMIMHAQIVNSSGFPSRHKVEPLMQASEGDAVVDRASVDPKQIRRSRRVTD
jgi:hypothetical protein